MATEDIIQQQTKRLATYTAPSDMYEDIMGNNNEIEPFKEWLEREEDRIRCKVEGIVREKKETAKEASVEQAATQKKRRWNMEIPVEVKSSSEWSKPDDKEPISKSRWDEFPRTTDEDTSLETSHKSSSKNVGKVEIQTSNNSTSKEINIARANSIPCMKDAFPEVIPAREISLERQWYLYEEIRQHVQDPFKRDLYCFKPTQPKPKKLKAPLQFETNNLKK
ncbi:32222_t:CDS:2 [Gigaspora margarita]|uniref:32222_t:CDS:1 n=1 Tax=Gigaspora margarita TaxID=4874 RepID=A0ABN7VG80_GIGMA|nr:32222_t:CDS:2 [Gigaspora margarita]